MSTSQYFWRASLLGTIHGALVGLVASGTLIAIIEYQNTQMLERVLDGTYLTETFHIVGPKELAWLSLLVISLCCVCFATSSYIIHRLLSRRVTSLYVLWQFIGLVAVGVWCLIVLSIDINYYRHGKASLINYAAPFTWDLVALLLIVVLVLVMANFIYAALLQLALTQYARLKGPHSDASVARAV